MTLALIWLDLGDFVSLRLRWKQIINIMIFLKSRRNIQTIQRVLILHL